MRGLSSGATQITQSQINYDTCRWFLMISALFDWSNSGTVIPHTTRSLATEATLLHIHWHFFAIPIQSKSLIVDYSRMIINVNCANYAWYTWFNLHIVVWQFHAIPHHFTYETSVTSAPSVAFLLAQPSMDEGHWKRRTSSANPYGKERGSMAKRSTKPISLVGKCWKPSDLNTMCPLVPFQTWHARSRTRAPHGPTTMLMTDTPEYDLKMGGNNSRFIPVRPQSSRNEVEGNVFFGWAHQYPSWSVPLSLKKKHGRQAAHLCNSGRQSTPVHLQRANSTEMGGESYNPTSPRIIIWHTVYLYIYIYILVIAA